LARRCETLIRLIEKENEDDAAHDNAERKRAGGPKKSGSKLSLDSWAAGQGTSGGMGAVAGTAGGSGAGSKKRKNSGGGAAAGSADAAGPGGSSAEPSAKKAKATSSRQSS
jgi:hypothetical protein